MSEKVKNILLGLALITFSVFLFMTASEFDLVLFHIIPIDGDVTFPIIGTICALLGVAMIILTLMGKFKNTKDDDK